MATIHRIQQSRYEQQIIDRETGEIIYTGDINQPTLGKFRYYRVIKQAFFSAARALKNNKSLLVYLYMMDKANRDNIFLGTYEDLRGVVDVSKRTIVNIMVELQENDFIRMVHPTQWMLNPRFAVSCYDHEYDALIIAYRNLLPYRVRRPKNQKNNEEVQEYDS